MNEFAPHINAIATAVPPHVLHQAEVADRAGHVFTGQHFEHLRPVYANAEIETRHSCVPIEWYETGHSFAERNRLYLDNALALLEHAARSALEQMDLDPRKVDGIVVASTTGIATPSLDAVLVDRLGLPTRLSQVGVPEDGIPALVEGATGDGTTILNPREMTEEDYAELYRAAL